jgi:oligoendopeptidase F
MVGLELVAGYLVAWGVRKLRRVGTRLDEETDAVIDAGLDRLHDAIAAKLDADPALGKLEDEVSQGMEPSDRTLRRVQDAVEDAVEEDPDFGAMLEALLARLEEARNGASSIAGIDLRGAKGVQVGNFNTQTNTFN